ncbi:hypothetical protein [Rhizobium gallicum]|uniref:hypothetical protein n=1 Tax=Rhizobium gallicum TaxID=56730 RepID=UPI001EF813DD|nr:hypothetical protein [Rhizobium gallicum]ULJ75890.1 hypothetical protein L2W42_25680 [Rhizobium gallicum]
MNLNAHSALEFERQALEKLKSQYEQQGFTFFAHPGPDAIPAFLGSYRPDAIARKQGVNVIIEVRQRSSPATERSLNEIRRLVEGQPDWQFVITYGGSDPQTTTVIPIASVSAIRERLDEARTLNEQGHRSVAFTLGWFLLEAALHRLQGEEGKRPRAPGTVVETLAMLGYLTPETERQLRPLIGLRNRIVHGDIEAEPSDEDMTVLFKALDEALSED